MSEVYVDGGIVEKIMGCLIYHPKNTERLQLMLYGYT